MTKDLLDALREIVAEAQDFERRTGQRVQGWPDKARAASAEAALAEPHPDADGWIPWAGGDCPPLVDPDVLVEVKLRSGEEFIGNEAQYADEWEWDHDDSPRDIIAYRVVKP